MPDDPKNEPVQSDFDDWLAEEEAAAVDPLVAATPSEEVVEEVSTDDGELVANIDADASETDAPPEEKPAPEDLEAADSEPSVDDVAEEDATGEIHIDPLEDDVDDEPTLDDFDAVAEIPIIEPPVSAPEHTEPEIELEAFDGDDHDITGEVEIVTSADAELDLVDVTSFDTEDDYDDPAPVVELSFDSDEADDDLLTNDSNEPEAAASISFGEIGAADDDIDDVDTPPAPPEPPYDFTVTDPALPDPFEDTGEAVFVTGETAAIGPAVGAAATGATFADMWGVDESDEIDDEDATPPPDVFEENDDEFTLGEDQIRYGVTREHSDLAAAVAAADSEDTAQVALSAAIPGLESSVVGFEDVVEAEGYRKVRARASGDLVARVITGLVLVGALVASLFWRPALLLLATAVFVLGAGEFYTALVRHDRKPIALFGFIGIIAACAGAFLWSAAAIPIAFLAATVLLLLYYAITPGKADPMGNLALTTTVMVWAGLGSFAMLIARSDDYQVLIAGVVVVVAAADIAAFFVGRSIGRTKFAPWVSPNKTVEGLVAGVIVAFGLGAVLHFFPPFELTSGLAIGAAAAVLTPMGDLAMSAAKRSLGLKDMGSVLPGHGGFLDRIDGLLFMIPAAWAIFVWAGLL